MVQNIESPRRLVSLYSEASEAVSTTFRRCAVGATVCTIWLVAGISETRAQESLFRRPQIAEEAIPKPPATDSGAFNHLRLSSHLSMVPKRESNPEESEAGRVPISNWFKPPQDDQDPVLDLPRNRNQEIEEDLENAETVIPGIVSDRSTGLHSNDSESQNGRGSSERELIIQRYPDGKPQIEREVIQDEDGNFVNDGIWRVFSQQGERNIIAQGEYRRGAMEGFWMRRHSRDSSGLFSTRPFNLFEGPYTSFATFKDGKLDGVWSLQDAAGNKMFEVPYEDGRRQGTASWWYPNEVKMREVAFVDGVIHGRLREWDDQKKLTRDEEYLDGQQVIRNVTYYRPQQKETENFYLGAKLEAEGEDDWWRATPARLVSVGTQTQHGPISSWYDNGLPRMKGNYYKGVREGQFTWWHSNGTKQLQGSYKKGEKEGHWTWWHSNGMKATEGKYEGNVAVGEWCWWDEDGTLEHKKELDPPANDDDSAADRSAPEELPVQELIQPPSDLEIVPSGSDRTRTREPSDDDFSLEIEGLELIVPGGR